MRARQRPGVDRDGSPERAQSPAPAAVVGTGLGQAEAERRLAQHGYNEVPEKTTSPLVKLLSYFWGPIPWMIEVAAILSGLVRHWEDLAIILTLLVVNAGVGFWEEYQAGNTVAALKATLALRARVKRDGRWRTIPARELVPDDVVRLRLGDVVPADAALLDGEPLQVDQSGLTGESLPVIRGPGDVVYSGAIVKQGESDAIVRATGTETYFGKTVRLVEAKAPVSHFQRAVLQIGDYLILLAVALVALILGVALHRGDPLLTTLEFVTVLTVAAIPVAMPTVLSVTMAVGARLLARERAIVTRLASIEELAGVDVLCCDKTGTLTRNALTLGAPAVVAPGIDPAAVVRAAALASRAEDEDPIDAAVLRGTAGGTRDGEVIRFRPFDPVHKRTEATVRAADGHVFAVTKGAPQVVLDLVADRDRVRGDVEAAVNRFATRGFRSLGVARAEDGETFRYLGVLPLYDPPRADSAQMIATAREMGIDVKMVTGDQVAIASEIARQVGLGTGVLDAAVFDRGPGEPATDVGDVIERADGFGQVFPEHKYRIVESLQAHRHIVGMTGDGVNDAPALKRADAGIAVSGATDAARAAADIVLLTPGLSVIVRAVEESRRIFQRMTSYATYRIAETVRVLLFMTASIVWFDFYPLTPVMIVLLALLNDGAILSIAYDRVRYSSRPEVWDMTRVLGVATVLGLAGVASSFGLFYLAERGLFRLGPGGVQTLMYLKLSVAGHLTIFVTRTRGPFWSLPPSRVLLAAVLGTQVVATIIAVFGFFMTPIGWVPAAFVWAYALAWFLANDRLKLAAYRFLRG